MDEPHPAMDCEVCGGTDFHKEAGHFYCNECQTQSQQVQEHVFEQEDTTINKKTTRKIHKPKSDKVQDMLTSWECFNYILKGLTGELVSLGAKPELTKVVRCLWLKYLHKCEVFDINSNRPPKLSILGSRKDAEIVYNMKRRKRKRSRTSSVSSLSVRRQAANKRRALIKKQYEDLSQSQSLTNDSSLMNETLSSLKSASESSEGNKIEYNRYSKKELKNVISGKHLKEHSENPDLTCHKLHSRDFRSSFAKGPTNLTTCTLYNILYIALLIINDQIQLGDLLRFIREGHLSFACFRHFFPEYMSDEILNLPLRKEKLFSHSYFRKSCAKLVNFLNISQYLCKPNLVKLSERYCVELNLPKAFSHCVENLIVKTGPKMVFNEHSKTIPNYEGRVMSFIFFTLKLLFGLDGVTESKLSDYASLINQAENSIEMFNFSRWQQFIGCRLALMKQYHLPSALHDCDNVDSSLYINYLKTQGIKFEGSKRHIHSEVEDYLQVLDNLLDEVDPGIFFEPTLTPFSDYSQVILKHHHIIGDLLTKNFQKNSIDFLLQPMEYLQYLGNPPIRNNGANDNIITEDLMYFYKSTIFNNKKSKKTVAVKITSAKQDKFIEEFLTTQKTPSLKTTDTEILLANWQQGNQKEFQTNRKLLQLTFKSTTVCSSSPNKNYSYHYNPHERYWLNIPINPLAHFFPKQDADAIVAKFPQSFRTIMKECSRIAEQDTGDFFSEFLVTEMYLVGCVEFGCKNTKHKSKGIHEIKRTLANCVKHW